jgi:hypothetical protein
MPICKKCKDQCQYFPGEKICADCYWDEDSERKVNLRYNPTWVYQRAYSAAKVIFNKTDEEAKKLAEKALTRRFK